MMKSTYPVPRRQLATVAAIAMATATALADDPATSGVTLKNDPDAGIVEVSIRGGHFTTYHYGADHHMPLLWPVHAEGDVGITRNFPMGVDEPAVEDHPHHKSLYLTYGEVNGHDFWHVGRGRPGVIRTVKLETGNADDFAWIRAHKHWVRAQDDALVMEEIRELRFHDGPPSARVFDIISTFKATAGDVTFGDSKEGMLAVRVRPEIDGERGGMLTNSDGKQGEAKVYGKPASWMDYTGTVRGHGVRGVAILDHPANFRPAQWHVRDYGLACANPFGRRSVAGLEDGRHTLKNGESLTLRYRLFVHSGDHMEAGVAGQYARYIADEAVKRPIP